MMQLQRKVKVEKFFGGVNRQQKKGDAVDNTPLVITNVPQEITDKQQ
jgi:hypothetical protein